VTSPATVVLKARFGRRDRTASDEEDPPRPAPVARVPRVARVLALAHHWHGHLRARVARDQADLARLIGITRTRVTQVMGLLHLAPDVQEAILDLAPSEDGRDPVSELDLRRVAALVDWTEQRAAWRALLA
jgi:hypothetical protein